MEEQLTYIESVTMQEVATTLAELANKLEALDKSVVVTQYSVLDFDELYKMSIILSELAEEPFEILNLKELSEKIKIKKEKKDD